MERKIPFTGITARHIETMDKGLAICVTAEITARASGPDATPVTVRVEAYHYGKAIGLPAEREIYVSQSKGAERRGRHYFSINRLHLSIGFSGKTTQNSLGGTEPKYMDVRFVQQ